MLRRAVIAATCYSGLLNEAAAAFSTIGHLLDYTVFGPYYMSIDSCATHTLCEKETRVTRCNPPNTKMNVHTHPCTSVTRRLLC